MAHSTSQHRRVATAVASFTALALVASACGTRLDRDQVLSRGSAGVAPGEAVGVAAGGGEFDSSSGSGGTVGGELSAAGTLDPAADTGGGLAGEAGAAPGTESGPAGAGGAASGAASGSTGPTGPAKYGQGISDTEVRIGVSAPLSGAMAFVGDQITGAFDAYGKLAAEKGFLGGRKVKLVAYDDQFDGTKTLSNNKRLVEQDKVFLINGLFIDAAAQYLTQKKIPATTLGLSAAGFASRFPTVFPINGNAISFNQQFAYAVMKVFKYTPKTVAIQYDTKLTDQRGFIDIFKETWERLGVKVVSTDAVDFTDADCTSVVQKWQSLDVDWVQFMGIGYLLCLPAIGRSGWRPNVGMDAWGSSLAGLASMSGPAVDGVVTAWEGDRPWDGAPRKQTQVHKDLMYAVTKYRPSLNKPENLDSPVVRQIWVTMTLLNDWLNQEKSDFTQASFIRWMQTRKNYDAGIDPPIQSWAPDCKKGTDALAFGRYRWDAEKRAAVRDPETGYLGPATVPEIASWAKNYGGDCYLTKASDAALRQ